MGLRVKEELITGCQMLDRNQNKKPEQAMELKLATSGIFLDRTPIRTGCGGWATQKAHLGLDNLLLEEELRNFPNPSVLSSILHFSIAIETRESQCLVPFIYLYNEYSLHLGFAQDTP